MDEQKKQLNTEDYYKEGGRFFKPYLGDIYQHINGGFYKCIMTNPVISDNSGRFQACDCESSDGLKVWTFSAFGIKRYFDGKISWEETRDARMEQKCDVF